MPRNSTQARSTVFARLREGKKTRTPRKALQSFPGVGVSSFQASFNGPPRAGEFNVENRQEFKNTHRPITITQGEKLSGVKGVHRRGQEKHLGERGRGRRTRAVRGRA